MKDYLLTIYSIKTSMTFIKADNFDDAKQQISDQDDSIRWMQIPMMNYMSWCEDGKPVGAVKDFGLTLENYDKDTL